MTLIAIFAAALLGSCGQTGQPVDELNDPAKALQILVNTVPSGAEIYGVDHDSIGVLLGVTPMTFRYVSRETASGPVVYGTEVEQTIVRHFDIHDMLEPPYSFRCWLLKDGYKAHFVAKALTLPGWMNNRNFSTTAAFRPRLETVTVELVPSELGKAETP